MQAIFRSEHKFELLQSHFQTLVKVTLVMSGMPTQVGSQTDYIALVFVSLALYS